MGVKVSVILPSYNVADYIEQCVLSVANQTMEDIEILCIDAGSTDGTYGILERLSDKHSKIRLLRSDIKSYGYQMNMGIREAKGEYIGIVETDDYVDRDMFELMYRYASKQRPDVVKACHYELYEHSDRYKKELLVDYIPNNRIVGETFSPDNDPAVHDWDSNIWNGIYRKDFLTEKSILFQETPGAAFQDIAFQQMVMNEAETMLYVRCHVYHYRRVRPGASTWNPKCVHFIEQAYRDILSDRRLKENRRRQIYVRMVRAFFTELRKALCLSNFSLQDIEFPEAVQWFEEEVRQAIEEGIFQPNDLFEKERDELFYFLAGKHTYESRLKTEMEAVYGWLAEIRRKIGGKQVVVFGAGRYGMLLVPFLIRNGIRVDAMADNKRQAGECCYYGIPLFNADEVARRYADAFYIIANKGAARQISDQLFQKGISRKMMHLFDGANPALVAGMRRIPILAEREK